MYLRALAIGANKGEIGATNEQNVIKIFCDLQVSRANCDQRKTFPRIEQDQRGPK